MKVEKKTLQDQLDKLKEGVENLENVNQDLAERNKQSEKKLTKISNWLTLI